MLWNKRIVAASTAALLAGGLIAYAGDGYKDKAHKDKDATVSTDDNVRATDPAKTTMDRTTGAGAAVAQDRGAPSFPAGIQSKELDDAEDLRELLASVTEGAVNKGGLTNLVDNLVDQDRNRIGEDKDLMRDNDRVAQLDGRIQQIREAWKAKYGEEIDIDDLDDGEGPYQGVALMQGEIQDPTAVAGNWPVKVDTLGVTRLAEPTRGTDATADVGDQPAVRLGIGDNPAADSNLDQGREVALAHLPGVNGMQGVTASIIGEVQAWKIDVPNTLTAQKLHDNLLTHLTHFGENQAQWPADQHQAQRLLTHHVLMALYDMPVDAGGQQRDIGDVNKQQPMQPNNSGSPGATGDRRSTNE